MSEDVDEVDGDVSGHGWMIGPYTSARLSEHLYFDGRVTWGRSDNEARQSIEWSWLMRVSSRPQRWLAEGGTAVGRRGSSTTCWCSPEVGVAYIEEKQNAYDVRNGGNSVDVDGQTVSIGRLNVAQEIGYRYDLETMQLVALSPRPTCIGTSSRRRASCWWTTARRWTSCVPVARSGIRVQSNGGIAGSLAVNYDGLFGDDLAAFGVKGAIAFPFQ